MRRSILLGAGLLAVLLVAIGGYRDPGANGQTAAAKGGGRAAGTELLAIQNGSGASLRRRREDGMELVIERPSPRTLYFADSPGHSAQTAPVGRLVAWVRHRVSKEGHPPNVALSWNGPSGPGSLAATLRHISYSKGHLRATLDPLRAKSGAPASLHGGRLRVETFSNRAVSMVLDGSNPNRCYAEIHTNEGEFWNLEGSSAEDNDWERPPPETFSREAVIGGESTSIWHGCEFSVRYGDGEGHGVTIKVDNPFVGSASYACQAFGGAICNAETLYYEENNEAHMQAEIYLPR